MVAESKPIGIDETTTETEQNDSKATAYDDAYAWPKVQYDVSPYRTYHFYQQFRTGTKPNNFLKGVKWSPDGSCFLTCSDDNALRIFSLPYDDSGNYVNDLSWAPDSDSYGANLVVGEGESVYDYCWYPHMSASNPDLCVFATTTRDHPIHLWDANSGELRCTYRAYDAMDEISAAFSIGFNPAGTKGEVVKTPSVLCSSLPAKVVTDIFLYLELSYYEFELYTIISRIFAGYNKTIRKFDVHRPGRDFEQYSTLSGNKEGQSGIISSIAFSPSVSGMVATGSYSQTTALYREDNMELLYVLHGQEGGVTQVQFSKDGNYLYTGGRKDPYILCWDIRKTAENIYKLYRSSDKTNQRIQFDIEHGGQHLGTGGQDGLVHIYELQTGQWVSSFQAALDTVNGVAFHPYLPMAATSSGHRRFGVVEENEENTSLRGDENCLSVWSFYYSSTTTVEGDDVA